MEDLQALEEVIVIGYGTAKRKDFTGSVSSVKLEDSPVALMSNMNALEPKIPCFCNHIYSSLPDVLSLPLKVYGISRRSKTSR